MWRHNATCWASPFVYVCCDAFLTGQKLDKHEFHDQFLSSKANPKRMGDELSMPFVWEEL